MTQVKGKFILVHVSARLELAGFELSRFDCRNLSVFKGVLQGTHPLVLEHLREDALRQMFLLHNGQKDTGEQCAVTCHIFIILHCPL